VRDLNFHDTGCGPTRGPRAVIVLARRGLRWTLRPMFVRLVEILGGLIDRLDRADRRHDQAEARHDRAEVRLAGSEARHDRAEVRLAGSEARHDRAEVRLADAGRRLDHDDTRLDRVEQRLDTAEWNGEFVRVEVGRVAGLVLRKAEQLGAHLEGLSAEHGELRAGHGELRTELVKRVSQLNTLSETTGGLGRRQDETEDRFEAVKALHWDHVALARRLAVIEDLLSVPAPSGGEEPRPSIPFPGLEDGARARVS